MTLARVALEWMLPIAFGGWMLFLLLDKRWPSAAGGANRRSHFVGTWVLTRLVFLALVRWVFPSDSTTDLDWFRQLHADSVLAGRIPGQEFPTWYGPLFPLLQTLGVLVTPGRITEGVLLPFLAGDLLGLAAAGALDRRFGWSGSWRGVQGWLLLSPAIWHQMIQRGQDEVLLCGFLLVSVVLFAQRRPAICGLALGVGLLCTKISFLPYAFGFLALSRTRKEALVGLAAFLLPVAAGAAYAYLFGIRVFSFEGLAYQIGLDGISLVDVLRRMGLQGLYGPSILFAVAAAAGTVVIAGRRLHAAEPYTAAIAMGATVHAVTMLSMPSSLPPYLAQAMVLQYALGRLLGGSWRGWALSLGAVVLSVTSSLWWIGGHWFGHTVHTVLSFGLQALTLAAVFTIGKAAFASGVVESPRPAAMAAGA